MFALVGGMGATGAALTKLADVVFEFRRRARSTPRLLRHLGACLLAGTRFLPRRLGNLILDAFAPCWILLTISFWLFLLILGLGLLEVFVELVSSRNSALRPAPTLESAYLMEFSVVLLPPIGVALGSVCVHLMTYVSAYRRREREVGRIATELAQYGDADRLAVSYLHAAAGYRTDRLLAEWTDWLIDLQHSHLSCPALIYSASRGTLTWPRAAVAVLDAAALLQAVTPSRRPPQIPGLLLAGSRCLQQIAWKAGVVAGGAPVSLEYREERMFSDSVRLVVGAGVPEEQDRDATWAAFQQLRAAYAPYATALEFRLMRRAG
ncbi:hypothetical protein [Micromonospora sp. NBS 11-29]|uniref:hypothetical protein n=1 Tax=Micromonospora sp. NBS 11-29 TaxID=1960879 RepID=UPI001121ACE6|nr:hypothetical protein [Micromonospora sp. NBS 11-29]